MPVFAYKGFNASGKQITGTQDADNPRAIKANLRKDGIFITELKEARPKKKSGGKESFLANLTRERISSQELAVATRQLATLVGAGIPLVQALTALVDQVENEAFKTTWAEVKSIVNEGAGFGDALASHPKIFTPLYVNMVRAGETSGALEVVLERLADFTESQAELRTKLVGTMIYPIILVMMAFMVTGILFVFVIPKLKMIFDAQKVALPLPTQILIGLSTFTKDWGLLCVPFVVLFAYLFIRYIRSARGKPKWDRFVLKTPLFGSLVRMIAVTRFAKTLGTLLSSGVPMLAAFDIVQAVVQNDLLQEVIGTARDAVKEGEAIAQPLKRSGEFPPIVVHMIAIGEKSGQLEDMLNHVARSYEVQIDARLQAMTSILEPVMLVFMAVIVAFIVFSVLLPMLQITTFAG